ncbi:MULTISPECIES: alpha-L-fucosidase [Pasteurellaceae]|uniref:alpha-L-fucosidase n=1 Tax=Pasteurella atlantica TaxID=2827233 RepID=A0AAW8CMB8_9PAST|nr:alpha-L-fucosidase [Pasteurella atlantica]MBR0573473.1 alpha-L-fucosidase [Pasteurella atlantica]MDP8041565.1 alpha-L-fucosidase [Pasteurella atlantica]MDP8043702.1 alpha-L-fucosidase [Pasteurella atlantica]MDP8061657.1 alpha-L-fucosidase [Pasteurella atlantica]MDP8089338.1 alpha-L-fucosidase [Pasteurella atlantica]
MAQKRYHADWSSIRTHQVPEWYEDAKFGIFIHWGIYSVPAFAPPTCQLGEIEANEEWFCNNPYAEWYSNSINVKKGPTYEHHIKTYGEDFTYDQFIPQWKAEKWQPQEWAELFAQAGAKYVVLTTKHHDGFCLYPSKYTDFNCTQDGPKRDLMGELTEEVRNKGLRMGAYYSGIIDWQYASDPIFTESQNFSNACPTYEYADFAYKQVVELIDLYKPDVLWNDIGWPKVGEHMLPHLFAHYYNTVADGVVDDRWNKLWCDFTSKEYKYGTASRDKKWEMCRGMGLSFGYNQVEDESHLMSVKELVTLLVETVSDNGNLLLNIGPKADGTIPKEQAERLLALGKWLKVNGEGIYGSKCSRHLTHKEQDVTYYHTKVGEDLYVFLDGLKEGKNELPLALFGEVEALNPELQFSVENTQNGRVLHIDNYQTDWYILGFKIKQGEK